MAAYDDIDQLFELMDYQEPAPGPAFRETLAAIQAGNFEIAPRPNSRPKRLTLVRLVGSVVAATLLLSFVTINLFSPGTSVNTAVAPQNFNATVVATVEDQENAGDLNSTLPSGSNPQLAPSVTQATTINLFRSTSDEARRLQKLLELEELSARTNWADLTKVQIELTNANSIQVSRPPNSRAF